MEQQEVNILPNVRVVLQSSLHTFEEVVVVAYGTQSSKAVTASIASVKADAFKDVPSVSFDQMLQGRAAGINVTSPSGAVGQAPVINIRGVSSINSGTDPLYVVDGMPISSGEVTQLGNSNPLADINPADILSIDILKDAAATALYGSRAANGVVLITTKQGQRGATRINYDMNVGFSNRTNFPEIMNAQQYVDFKTMAYKNMNGQNAESPFKLGYDANGNVIDTNWADLIFQNGFSQTHSLSVSGASDKVNYYLSVNYSDMDGIVIGDKYNRTGMRGNISYQANDWLKVGLNSTYTKSETANIDGARNGSTFASSGFPRSAITLPSNVPAYNEDGSPYYEGQYLGYGPNGFNTTFFNPVALQELGNGINVYNDRMIGNVFIEVTPIKNLRLKTQYGIDKMIVEEKRFWSPLHGDGYSYEGNATAYHTNFKTWTWTNTANYSFELENHHFDVLLGMEATETNTNVWGFSATELNDSAFPHVEANYNKYNGSGGISDRSLISYFGRINYDYNYKYMFSANFRRDGYSPLGTNSRWGNFGGVSAAWRLSEEAFFADARTIFDEVKLKASWGLVGNAKVGYYPAKSYYTAGYYGDHGTYRISNIGDANLKWESSNTFDIGLSLRLLNMVNLEIDYYNTTSSDLILGVPQAPSAGIPGASLVTNAGKLKNEGVEVTVSADIIKNRNFNWYSSFNITFNKNRILTLTDPIVSADDNGYESNNITVEGKSIGQLYLFPTGGIDEVTGRRIFYGARGEKVYYDHPAFYLEDGSVYDHNAADAWEQVIAGNTLPTWYGGWQNTLSYKGFDLNVFFQFSGGNHIYNGTKATSSDMRFWNNTTDVLKNHWSESNRNATYARPVYGDNYSNGSAMPITDWVEKGDYLRLKNISLGYTFDTKKWPTQLGIRSLRLYAQAQNLFVITDYSGLDPEVISNVMSPVLTGGVDKNTLPQARTYTFGLNVTF